MNKEIQKTQEIGEGFSSIDFVCQCLIDEEKFFAFEKVLKKCINTNSTVVEFGTGSGILSLLSARLGAKKVLAVEFDPYIADIAKENIRNNKFEDKIEVINEDARCIDFTKKDKIDVVVMEMLATGLVDEMQVLAMNNIISQNVLSQNAKVVPFAQENYISLAYTDFNLYGFEMKMVRHLWSHDDNENLFKEMTPSVLLNKIVFALKNNEEFKTELEFSILEDATKINSLCLTSKILVDEEGEVVLESTHSLNPIVLIPLPEKVFKENDIVRISVSYRFGGGFKNFIAKYI